MINVYPTKIEATNELGQVMFRMKMFDEHSSSIDIETLLSPSSVDELFAAIREGMAMMKLEKYGENKP